MSDQPSSARRWVLGLVVGLVLLIGIASLLAMPYSRVPIDDYIAKVEASGRPTTVRAAIGSDPAPETNGAVDVEAAAKWLVDSKGERDTWTVIGPWQMRSEEQGPWGDRATDEERRALDAFFADAKPMFERLAAGFAKPRMRIPTPEGVSLEDSADDVGPRWRVVQVLAALASCAMKAQDRLDAAELLAKLAVRFETRTFVDEFVAAGALDYVTDAVRREIARGGDAAAWSARLDGFLVAPRLPRFPEAVRRDRAFQLEYLRTADLSKVFADRSPDRSPPTTWKGVVKRVRSRFRAIFSGGSGGGGAPQNSPTDLVRGLEATERFETAPTDSYPRLVAEIDAVAKAAPEGSTMAVVVSWIPHAAAKLAGADASNRLARIALAAAAYRARHGDFPASLDDLKSAFPDGVPADPLVDAPFVYEKTSTGVRIATSATLSPDLFADELEHGRFVWELKR